MAFFARFLEQLYNYSGHNTMPIFRVIAAAILIVK
jgi:hypothetical protein